MRLGGRGMVGPHGGAGDAGTEELLADPPPYWVLRRESMRFLGLECRHQTPINESLPFHPLASICKAKHGFWRPSQLLLTKPNP